MQVKDQNGNNISRNVRRETINGQRVWGCNVWFGSDPATTLRRYYYGTRAAARLADISDRPYAHGEYVGGEDDAAPLRMWNDGQARR